MPKAEGVVFIGRRPAAVTIPETVRHGMRLKRDLRPGWWNLVLVWLLLTSAAVIAETPAVRTIQLGQSTVVLNGPWSFHPGDQPAWSQPDYDDSQWPTLDLTPPEGSYDHLIGSTGFVPGWTARGYPGYTGFAWYRLHVTVNDGGAAAGQPLALKMPDNCDDAYEVYVNGRLLGGVGTFSERDVKVYLMRPRAMVLSSGRDGAPITIAIRTWMGSSTPLTAYKAGGLHGPPVLGENSSIQTLLRMDWDAIDHANYSQELQAVMLLTALIVIVVLARQDRNEPTYLWLGLSCVVTIVILGPIFIGVYTEWISRTTIAVLQDDLLFPLRIGLWIIFWGHWFRFERMRQLHAITWGLVFTLALGTALQRAPLYGSIVPAEAVAWLLPLTISVKLLLGALLVWVAYHGISRDLADAILAMPAVVLVGIAQYHYELSLLNVKVYYFPLGFRIALSQIGIILSMLIITTLLLRRFLGTLQERERLQHEMEQARQVQSMLVPALPPLTPGFALESVYLPASDVGGDFFHVLPEEDGSLVLVVGDVSGKGLRAAMTASAIIGALRNEMSGQSVSEMLAHLNRVLVGHISGFVTCCIARIAADGMMCIANAGHLAPYLNGEELQLNNSLPLGLDSAATFEAARFELETSQQLTLMTDGIVEARSKSGELFGFDRTSALSRLSAAAIAQAAQKFGQEDDITVLTLTRLRLEIGVQRAGATQTAFGESETIRSKR
jgi:hypothetical protein